MSTSQGTVRGAIQSQELFTAERQERNQEELQPKEWSERSYVVTEVEERPAAVTYMCALFLICNCFFFTRSNMSLYPISHILRCPMPRIPSSNSVLKYSSIIKLCIRASSHCCALAPGANPAPAHSWTRLGALPQSTPALC